MTDTAETAPQAAPAPAPAPTPAEPPARLGYVPAHGLVFSDLGELSEVLCKPKLLPIKSRATQILERLEKEALDAINNLRRAREEEQEHQQQGHFGARPVSAARDHSPSASASLRDLARSSARGQSSPVFAPSTHDRPGFGGGLATHARATSSYDEEEEEEEADEHRDDSPAKSRNQTRKDAEPQIVQDDSIPSYDEAVTSMQAAASAQTRSETSSFHTSPLKVPDMIHPDPAELEKLDDDNVTSPVSSSTLPPISSIKPGGSQREKISTFDDVEVPGDKSSAALEDDDDFFA